MSKLLITYVTKTNTTSHAATIIKDFFESKQVQVDLCPISEVSEIKDYDEIIVGAPINGMNWHPDAKDFVVRFRNELKEKKIAYFFMSYIVVAGRKFWKNTINKSLDSVTQIKTPVSIGRFGGAVDKGFPFPARLLFGIKKGTPIDVQDDENVKSWAKEVFNKFEI